MALAMTTNQTTSDSYQHPLIVETLPKLHDPILNLKPECIPTLIKGSILGEVHLVALRENHPLVEILYNCARRHNLERSNVEADCLLVVNGSVGPHDDDVGLVLTWLVHSECLNGFEHSQLNKETIPTLISCGQMLEIHPGNVFIFNSNENHAWLSNNHCVFVQICVRYANLAA
jgi:hypothetical protein